MALAVVSTHNFARAQRFFRGIGLMIVEGSRNLEG